MQSIENQFEVGRNAGSVVEAFGEPNESSRVSDAFNTPNENNCKADQVDPISLNISLEFIDGQGRERSSRQQGGVLWLAQTCTVELLGRF